MFNVKIYKDCELAHNISAKSVLLPSISGPLLIVKNYAQTFCTLTNGLLLVDGKNIDLPISSGVAYVSLNDIVLFLH